MYYKTMSTSFIRNARFGTYWAYLQFMDYSAEAFLGGLPLSLMRFGPFVGPLLLFLMGFMLKIAISHFSQLLLLEEFCNESSFYAT